MKAHWLIACALLCGACKKNAAKKEAPAADAGAKAAPLDAAKAPPVVIDAGDAAYKYPAGATELDDKALEKADASALGTAVEAWLISEVGEDTGGPRKFAYKLVLTGGGKAIIAWVNYGYAEFDEGTAEGALMPAEPLEAGKTFPAEDYAAPLPFKGPLLFLDGSQGGGMSVDMAVAQDGDTLMVWSLVVDEGATPDDIVWTEDARIKLAPGAKVAAK